MDKHTDTEDPAVLAGLDKVLAGDAKPSIDEALRAIQRASGTPSITRVNEALSLSHAALGLPEPKTVFSVGKATAEIAVLRDKLLAAKVATTAPSFTPPVATIPKPTAPSIFDQHKAIRDPQAAMTFYRQHKDEIDAHHSAGRKAPRIARLAQLEASIEEGEALKREFESLGPREQTKFIRANGERIREIELAEAEHRRLSNER